MFSEYVEKALSSATYDALDDGTFSAEIPGFEGVWSNGQTIEAARTDLQDALEGWLLLGLWQHDERLPVLEGLTLIPRPVEEGTQSKREPTPASRSRKAS